jgi:imidazole glycerol-phosphate synthase subunit HisH
MMRIGIFDYGAGNLHSLVKAIQGDARCISVDTDIRSALGADVLILPGVGAFGAAIAALDGHQEYVRSALADGKPCLGVCLGMQMLFDESEESPGSAGGIGLISGRVTRLTTRKVPHIGWNEIAWIDRGTLGTAYFANAYVCEPEDVKPVIAWTTHQDARFASVVRTANTVGVQFHPEKSSAAGRTFINDVIDEVVQCR